MKTARSLLLALALVSLSAAVAAAQASRPSVSASEVNGTYKMSFAGKYRKMSNDLKILAIGGGKLRIAFDLIYPYTDRAGEISANLGEIEGEATIKGDTAVFASSEFGPCTITIKFVRPGLVKVTQDGSDADCGFGHNVTAGGTYRKVSAAKPKF